MLKGMNQATLPPMLPENPPDMPSKPPLPNPPLTSIPVWSHGPPGNAEFGDVAAAAAAFAEAALVIWLGSIPAYAPNTICRSRLGTT